jgi:hypothetical protein
MAELERRMAGATAPQVVQADSTSSPQADPPRADLTRTESNGSRGSTNSPQASPLPAESSAPPQASGEPGWPDESAETAFLAEKRTGEVEDLPIPTAPTMSDQPSIEKEILPALETLLPRIPPEVIAALDEHFLAKFTGVRRVPKEALKP